MTITILTSNHPRHTAFVNRFAQIASTVFAIQECTTIHPGKVDDFFRKSQTMQTYFTHVIRAEREVFGRPAFAASNVRAMPIRMGDLNLLDPEILQDTLNRSDHVVVFGASYIKPPLVDRLIEKRAINIHMGVSPWYRGSSTNFWAMYDRRPEFVGATVHRLSRGLDSGEMLFHAFPAAGEVDPFTYGMLAVRAAQEGLARSIESGAINEMSPVAQDRTKELRYTRNADFTDDVAEEYLKRLPSPAALGETLRKADRSPFLRPFVHKIVA